jgi:hypothetical protein
MDRMRAFGVLAAGLLGKAGKRVDVSWMCRQKRDEYEQN